MTLRDRIILLVLGWVTVMTGLHGYLNVNWIESGSDRMPEDKSRLSVAYIPVT